MSRVYDAAATSTFYRVKTLPVVCTDTTAPVVNVFTIPETSSSLTVPVTTLTVSETTGVKYLITETPVVPTRDQT